MPPTPSYRAEWIKAGYGPVMGSAVVVRPPSANYIRVYHLTSTEHAISNLALGRLKVARFADLNDPFELLAASFQEKPIRTIIREFKDETNMSTGLLCFSENWTNPVLWSHYGARHSGICLGFDLKRDIAERVNYESDRILTELGDNPPQRLDNKTKKLLICTKFAHWSYEQEVRSIVSLDKATAEGQLHFYQFSRDLMLREVVIGPACTIPLDTVRELTALRNADAVVFKSRLAFKTFDIVPDERTVP